MLAFNQIYVSTHFDIPNACSVLRCFANTFSKALVKKESDKIVQDKKARSIQRNRLENIFHVDIEDIFFLLDTSYMFCFVKYKYKNNCTAIFFCVGLKIPVFGP